LARSDIGYRDTPRLGGDFGRELDLYTRSEGDLRDSERAASVRAALAEDLDEELGRPVGNDVLLLEIGCAVHEHEELHDARDGVEIARRRVQRRDEVDGDRPRGQLALLNIDTGAELTDPRLAIPLCNVPRQEDQSVAADEGHERGDGRRYGGKIDGEGLEALIDRHVHRARK